MKYYWLRLQRDFFKRHDIRIVESAENGKDYILFYLKLLVESIDHNGELRFSDTIPYNDAMLATITNTNIDIVRAALAIFKDLGMIEVLKDETIYMCEVEKMIGVATQDDHMRESARIRKQRQREREKQKALPSRDSHVTCHGEIEKEIDIEIEIDKEKEINKEKESVASNAPARPQKHKYGEYSHVLLTDNEYNKLCSDYGDLNTSEAIKYLDEYIEMKGYKAKNHNLALRKWVFDAVKERASKKQKQNASGSFWERLENA